MFLGPSAEAAAIFITLLYSLCSLGNLRQLAVQNCTIFSLFLQYLLIYIPCMFFQDHPQQQQRSGLFPSFPVVGPSSMRIRGEPQVFVSVAYDFEYLAEDGKRVFMKESEILLLINKTNHDWWQVRSDVYYRDRLQIRWFSQPPIDGAESILLDKCPSALRAIFWPLLITADLEPLNDWGDRNSSSQ